MTMFDLRLVVVGLALGAWCGYWLAMGVQAWSRR
jgi:hypothetical protein